jgi:hypothetical protein
MVETFREYEYELSMYSTRGTVLVVRSVSESVVMVVPWCRNCCCLESNVNESYWQANLYLTPCSTWPELELSLSISVL